ncbi:MAG: Asp-tRNA(Asn)/Glu-tRNA(Gln) amidotransferase subunit GatC [Flavobacteriales bacterium]|nr:Asp-tRNA(Asn)/Glu-tRNA(Gln) amidotransferase subunit GatC [Flavobacteriales bacterium]
MKIDENTLDRVAELARLDLSDPAVRASTLVDMQRVISFVEVLGQVDTTGVEPLVFMTGEQDVLRSDAASMEITKDQALANAPVKDSDYFKVPKVVG